MMPSPGDLVYFTEVASSLNLSRAAERLGISQPSVTTAIQRLEHAIGTPLLIRSKQGVTPTQAGKQLLLHTRELIQKWEMTKSLALASTNEIQGYYSIGCHTSVALYSLANFLPKLLEDHPKLEIKLQHNLSRRITESVIRMQTDIGIVVNPVRHPDLIIKKLVTDDVTFFVGEGSRKIQNIHSGQAVLIYDPDLLQAQDLMKQLRQRELSFARALPSPSLEVITKLVAAGTGVGILPGRVASSFNLQPIPHMPTFHDEICLLYRVENKNLKSIQTISDCIVSSFALSSAHDPIKH